VYFFHKAGAFTFRSNVLVTAQPMGLESSDYLYIHPAMLFAVVPAYERGRRFTEKELDAKTAAVGELMIYEAAREAGGPLRRMAGLTTPMGHLLKPILEPRLTGMTVLSFSLRGLEELETSRGYVYVLQEWRITEARHAQKGYLTGNDPRGAASGR
jgi:hypothetical protein